MTSPESVSIPARETTLHGCIYRPTGPEPVPAVIWNHGSERDPGSSPTLGAFYAAAGYALLVPHRRGHGRSPSDDPLAAVAARTARGEGERRELIEAIIAAHERGLADVLAAAEWLAGQPFVDPARIAMSGVSHGGVQTLLAAEAGAGIAASVPFAPAAIGWDGNPELQRRLIRAVGVATAPIFLVQAGNDYSLGPSEGLGEELRRKGEPNRCRVFPPYGEGEEDGHGAFAREGVDVWGTDVRAFLDEALTRSAAAS